MSRRNLILRVGVIFSVVLMVVFGGINKSQPVTDKSLYVVQEEAKEERRGLWHDYKPMSPWE